MKNNDILYFRIGSSHSRSSRRQQQQQRQIVHITGKRDEYDIEGITDPEDIWGEEADQDFLEVRRCCKDMAGCTSAVCAGWGVSSHRLVLEVQPGTATATAKLYAGSFCTSQTRICQEMESTSASC